MNPPAHWQQAAKQWSNIMSHPLVRAGAGLLFLAIILMAGPASAESTFEIIGEFYLLDLSADGSAGCGNTTDGYYETFRWTPADGMVPLGMSSARILSDGAGSPNISADGQRISASIATMDSLYLTQGRWTKGLGWEETMPPMHPDGRIMDDKLGSAWSISGDGETVVGLYWKIDVGGMASSWTSPGGLVDLGGQAHRGGRANNVNFDGSVIVGQTPNPVWGGQMPTVWDDGVMTVLTPDNYGGTLGAVTSDGTMVAGNYYDLDTDKTPAAIWIKTPTGWDRNTLGLLPGSIPNYGRAFPLDMCDDGSMVVGDNFFTMNSLTGFVWTSELGMMSGMDFITSLGLTPPPGFVVLSMSTVSQNGNVLGGYGYEGSTPGGGPIVSFLITIDTTTGVPSSMLATDFDLGPAYPNPFNPSTSFNLAVKQPGHVLIEILDVRGMRVRVLDDNHFEPGNHVLNWDGRSDQGRVVGSGVYLGRARDEQGASQTQRMILLK
jgi:hypothetical protein